MNAWLDQIAWSFDIPILDWIASFIKCAFLDVIMPVFTQFGDAPCCIIVAILLLLIPKTRRYGVAYGLGLGLGVIICNVFIKNIFHRTRPYDLIETEGRHVELLVKRLYDYSLPSGHTNAFCALATTVYFFDWKWGIVASLGALSIAFSRLYLYMHYPTDVFCGMLAGVGAGIVGALLSKKVYPYVEKFFAFLKEKWEKRKKKA